MAQQEQPQFPRVTPETMELIRSIGSPPGRAMRLLGWTDHRPQLLKQLADTGEIRAIPAVICLLFDSSPDVAGAASDCLHDLVSGTTPLEKAFLDARIRSLDHWMLSGRDCFRRILPANVPKLAKTASSRASVLGLASFHGNGYVRAAALHCLDEINDGTELPFLLIRLNDWVQPVREQALAAVRRRLISERLADFVQNTSLIVRLANCARADHNEVIRWVIDGMADPKNCEILRHVVENTSNSTRRSVFRLALESRSERFEPLVSFGLQSGDPVLRFWAARHARQTFDATALAAILPSLEADRAMPVRREAMMARVEHEPSSARDWLEKGLIDRHASIRELARFHLGKLGLADFADVYRRLLVHGHSNIVALAGLAETGSKGDVPTIRPFFVSKFAKERAAAIRALGSLAGDEFAAELLASLPDDAPKVTKAALKGLAGHLDSISPDAVWSVFQHETRRHVRSALFILLSQFGGWGSFPFLIRVTIDSDEKLAERASTEILWRFNRVFTKPTAAEIDQMRQALADTRDRMPDRFARDLSLGLKSRGWYA